MSDLESIESDEEYALPVTNKEVPKKKPRRKKRKKRKESTARTTQVARKKLRKTKKRVDLDALDNGTDDSSEGSSGEKEDSEGLESTTVERLNSIQSYGLRKRLGNEDCQSKLFELANHYWELVDQSTSTPRDIIASLIIIYEIDDTVESVASQLCIDLDSGNSPECSQSSAWSSDDGDGYNGYNHPRDTITVPEPQFREDGSFVEFLQTDEGLVEVVRPPGYAVVIGALVCLSLDESATGLKFRALGKIFKVDNTAKMAIIDVFAAECAVDNMVSKQVFCIF